ncbi:MAG: GNAT family N-acetyltransferase [Gammaproteobacteria bacterium]|nr:MAG: GNAT family N-acetyltransferase [Gammaproteobacteria bacterium]
MKIVFTDRIASVEAEHWNNLIGGSNPFIQHDFLLALEQHGCLEQWGWYPQHCLLYDKETLIGACPAYIKDNSYGEFVFDWAWADAYQRNGLDYYPKLVCAIPFTPAQGPRLLTSLDHVDDNGNPIEPAIIKKGLINALIAFTEKNKLSSAHFLFCESNDINQLSDAGLILRYDYQFHWTNRNYKTFDEFLSQLTSKRRKNIRRERRKVAQNNVQIEVIYGENLNDEQWDLLYTYYRITFMKKSGAPTLTLDFFKAVANKIRAIFAYHQGRTVAAAICFEGKDKLYGRHWGCSDNYDSLHFEVCYYSGIEYCINKQLQVFEPGAQGEHKIWRGFLPTKTQSAHWIADENFRPAIKNFLRREAATMENHGKLLSESSPYKT